MPNFSSVLFVCFFFVPIPFVLYNRFMATTAPLMFAPGSSAIVIGSGLAGLSAASELVSRNISVHVLERSAKPGGNSYKASSGINGAPTRYQPLPDTAFYADTVKSAGVAMISARDRREQLIKTLTNKSSSAIDWLVEQHKVDLSSVSQLGGHSLPRTHRPAAKLPVGVSLINALLENLKTSALFRLETSCHVTRLLQNNSVVTGVEYLCDGLNTKTLHGPVIVASGGFGGDAKGLAQYRPDLAGFPSTNELRPGSVNLLTDVGAQLLDMEAVQIHPTGFVDPNAAEAASKFLAAEVLRGEGGLLLNASGRRFVDELQTRKHVTDAIMRTEPSSQASKQWDVRLVMDEGAYEATKTHMGFYLFKQLMRKTTVSELGTEAQAAVQSFAEAAAGKTSDEFGRTAFGSWSLKDVTPDSVVYVGNVTPVVHFTMGGALISERSEVLNAQEEPIKGVWAAGEVTGGVHGENRLGGSSLLECVVFGRTAGQQLAKVMQESKL